MRHSHFFKTNALGAAILGLGLAFGASAQTSPSTPVLPKPGAATGSMTVTSKARTTSWPAPTGVAEKGNGGMARSSSATSRSKRRRGRRKLRGPR